MLEDHEFRKSWRRTGPWGKKSPSGRRGCTGFHDGKPWLSASWPDGGHSGYSAGRGYHGFSPAGRRGNPPPWGRCWPSPRKHWAFGAWSYAGEHHEPGDDPAPVPSDSPWRIRCDYPGLHPVARYADDQCTCGGRRNNHTGAGPIPLD